MILDHLTSRAAGPGRSPSANPLSRRRLLQAGVAAGGGLLLSLNLPYANGDAEAANADGFAPNAFIRIGGDGQIVLTMLCRDGPRGLYVHPDVDRRRAGGEPETGAAGACSAQRKALRQSLAGRHPGNRQLERDTRCVAAPAPSRCDCENDARVGSGKALGCRSGVLPRAKR
jgi:hypothetical protein